MNIPYDETQPEQPVNTPLNHESPSTNETGQTKSFHNIILIGPMASGKTTIGWLLAKNLGMGFIDLDHEIEREEGKSVKVIFEEKGEEYFRSLEKKKLEQLKHIRGQVLAIGGGALNDEDNWIRVQEMGIKIWLNPPAEELTRRLMSKDQDLSTRPLLADLQNMKDLDQMRKVLIERMAALSGQRVHRYSKAELEVSDCFATPESTMRLIKRELQDKGYLDKHDSVSRYDKWLVFS